MTLEMCAIHAMWTKQCALYTCTAPYLGVGVKQAVRLVGEDLCEACKQSNATIGSDDVTCRWTDSMTVIDRHQQPQA